MHENQDFYFRASSNASNLSRQSENMELKVGQKLIEEEKTETGRVSYSMRSFMICETDVLIFQDSIECLQLLHKICGTVDSFMHCVHRHR